jgi:predicted ATPase
MAVESEGSHESADWSPRIRPGATISTLAVESYRSLRHLVVPLRRVNVVTGANGSGKSSLYRALSLLADTSRNGAVAALAREGGLASTLWAGPEAGSSGAKRRGFPTQGLNRRGAPVGLKLGFAGDEYGYAIDLGLPGIFPTSRIEPEVQTAFLLDPEIKTESIWHGMELRPSTLLTERSGSVVRIRDDNGAWTMIDHRVHPYDSMLSEFGAPERAPEVMAVREQLQSWRFYDHFRTDPDAPARQRRIGTRTPVLSADGSDLAAALQTIVEGGGGEALDKAIDHAFPGSHLEVIFPGSDPSIEDRTGVFEIAIDQPGLLRPLGASELSDGTLRYLLLIAALLSPRPPALYVLNEPESSLHPELLEPLANLIHTAAERTQVIVVTHARALVECLENVDHSALPSQVLELVKEDGETKVAGQRSIDQPSWKWPSR